MDILKEAGAYFLTDETVSGEALGLIHYFNHANPSKLNSLRTHIVTVNFFPFNQEGALPIYQGTAIGFTHLKRDFGDVRAEADELGITYFGHQIPVFREEAEKLAQIVAYEHTRLHVNFVSDNLKRVKEGVVPILVKREYDPQTESGAKRIEAKTVRRLYGVDIPQDMLPRLRELNPKLNDLLQDNTTGIQLSRQGLEMFMIYQAMKAAA